MIYRLANTSDFEGMHRVRMSVQENVLSDPGKITEADYIAMITTLGRGWVCEDEDQIVGFSIVDLEGKNIWALFVSPQYEGRGIGKKLHDLMMDWTAAQGLDRVWLSTADHSKAVDFYRKRGWQDMGLLPNGERRFEWPFDSEASCQSGSDEVKQPHIFHPLPVLDSQRLQLRKLSASDADELFNMLSDPGNCTFIDRKPVRNKGKVIDFIEFRNTGVENNEWGYWGIALRETDQLVGTICLWNISKNGLEAEVGYELSPNFQKRGYMSEALSLLMDFAFGVLEINTLKAYTHTENQASILLLKKHGFFKNGFIREKCKEKSGELKLAVFERMRE